LPASSRIFPDAAASRNRVVLLSGSYQEQMTAEQRPMGLLPVLNVMLMKVAQEELFKEDPSFVDFSIQKD
jgi:hypothetical protein